VAERLHELRRHGTAQACHDAGWRRWLATGAAARTRFISADLGASRLWGVLGARLLACRPESLLPPVFSHHHAGSHLGVKAAAQAKLTGERRPKGGHQLRREGAIKSGNQVGCMHGARWQGGEAAALYSGVWVNRRGRAIRLVGGPALSLSPCSPADRHQSNPSASTGDNSCKTPFATGSGRLRNREARPHGFHDVGGQVRPGLTHDVRCLCGGEERVFVFGLPPVNDQDGSGATRARAPARCIVADRANRQAPAFCAAARAARRVRSLAPVSCAPKWRTSTFVIGVPKAATS
jgi:hypothetical protein